MSWNHAGGHERELTEHDTVIYAHAREKRLHRFHRLSFASLGWAFSARVAQCDGTIVNHTSVFVRTSFFIR